jgi:pyridoxine 5-phosphate synthase
MIRLGVNIDHVATLRQARGEKYPSPIQAALCAHTAGADLITLHLREDRRHIQDEDVFAVRHALSCPLNFEMAVTDEMLGIAEKLLPDYVCLVPEKREELTTEGGLDVWSLSGKIREAIEHLHHLGIAVSLFVDPHPRVMEQCAELGAHAVELHTGEYAKTWSSHTLMTQAMLNIQCAAFEGKNIGLSIHAGHGLTIHNVTPIAQIPEIEELNIGHALIADSIFIGLHDSVARMKYKIQCARFSIQNDKRIS